MKKLLWLLPLCFIGCTNEQQTAKIHMRVRGTLSGRIYNATLTQPVNSENPPGESDFTLIQSDN
jgi:hypothetical protein